MDLKIHHETIYQFDDEVFFEPHTLRFKPSTDHYLTVEKFHLKVSPDPVGFSEQMDIENNMVLFCWFEGLHKELKITLDCTVTIQEFNPFNYLIYPGSFLTVPFEYPNQLKHLLTASLNHTELSNEIVSYLNAILKSAKNDTASFILALTQQIHSDFKVEIREEGVPMSPNDTFRLRRGSCRDLAWLQIQCLRHLGVASRFVSGYYYLDVEEPVFELHAWVIAYIPGAGWLGFDPTHGIAAGHTHIPIAKSAHYENTMPVSGTIRGGAKSKMQFNLDMELKA
ncbi:transglutaminase family protein [Ekhidna sp.]|uniref:transglutaminase family protein n=1 Tax=Ekhidna sp. TaxID=2608089 RepID=UPI003B5088C3